jgi:hypothetical protein
MTTQPEGPRPADRRRPIVYGLLLLAVAVPAVYYATTCDPDVQPTGTCLRSDTTIVASNVTEEGCRDVCPRCTWRQAP